MLCYGSEMNWYDRQWDMTKQLGKKYSARNWILYYDMAKKHSYWSKLWLNAMKYEQDLGYFTTNIQSFSNSSNASRDNQKEKGSTLVTLHLYVRPDLQPLNSLMLVDTSSYSNSHQPRSDVWLIKMPNSIEGKGNFSNRMNEYDMYSGKNVYYYSLLENGSIKVNRLDKTNPNYDTVLEFNEVWSGKDEFQDNHNELWSMHRSLQGANIRVVSAYAPPAVTYIEDGCTSKSCFKGIFANVFHALADQMNFTFTIKRAYMWGSVTNGTWNGMVNSLQHFIASHFGMLNEKLADIAATDLTITNARSTVVDFLPPLMEITEELYMKNPGDAFSNVSYIGSFTKVSWTAIAIFLISVPLVLSAIMGNVMPRNAEYHSLFECYILTSASILNLAYALKSSMLRNRIALLSVMIGGMLIYSHWEAQLISHLAFKKFNFPFSNLKEFSDNSKFKLMVARGTVFVDFFRCSDYPVRTKIWRDKLEPFIDKMPMLEDIKDSIIDDPYTVTYADSTLRMTEEYISCKFIDIKPPIRKTQLAFALQKDSALYQAFNYHINSLKEVGLMQKYIKSHRMEAQVCDDYSGGPVTIQQCYTAFQILAAGMFMAFLGFILEMFVRPKLLELMRKGKNRTKDDSKLEKRIMNLEKIIEALQNRKRQLELKRAE